MREVELADGTILEFPDNTPDAIMLSAGKRITLERAAATPKEAPKEYAGFFGSMKEAAATLGATPETAAFLANQTPESRKALIADTESKYKSADFGLSPTEDLSTFGRNIEALKQTVGGTLGSLAAPLAVGAVTGGIGGFGTIGAQYGIQNIARQAREQQAAIDAGRTPEELSLGKAAIATAGQTALDVAGGKVFGPLLSRFPLFKNLAIGGKPAQEAIDVMADAAKNGKWSFSGKVARGVGKGVAFEAPQEVAQQALELWQAGVPTDQWRNELIQAGIGGALLGGPIGGAQAALEARAKAKEKAKTEAGFGGEEPPPPPGAPPSGSAAEKAAEAGAPKPRSYEEVAAEAASDPALKAEFDRLASRNTDPDTALVTARTNLGREAPRGPEQIDQRPAGESGDVRPEPSVSPPSGEGVDARVADPAARTPGAGLEFPSGPAQQVGTREVNVPRALDEVAVEPVKNVINQVAEAPPIKGIPYIRDEDEGARQERQYEYEQKRELEREQENYEGEVLPTPEVISPTTPTAVSTAAPILTLDPSTPKKARTTQAIEAVKAIAATDAFKGVEVANKDINQAAQRLVNSNGGDPYVSLTRVLEGEPAVPKKIKAKVAEEVPFEGAPEAAALAAIPAAPVPEAIPLTPAAPAAPAAPIPAAPAAPIPAAPAAPAATPIPEAIPPTAAPIPAAPAAPAPAPAPLSAKEAQAEIKAQADAERAISGYAYQQNKPGIDAEYQEALRNAGLEVPETEAAPGATLGTTPGAAPEATSPAAPVQGTEELPLFAAATASESAGKPSTPVEVEEKLSVNAQKFRRGFNATQGTAAVGAAIKEHDASAFIAALKDKLNAFSLPSLEVLLKFMPDSVVADIAESVNKQFGITLRRIKTEVDALSAKRANLTEAFNKIGKSAEKFVNKYGNAALSKMQVLARLNRIDVTAHDNVGEALKNDSVMQGYVKLLANTNIPGEIKNLKENRAKREAHIKEAYVAWDELGKQKNGQREYIRLRQFYKDMYALRRTLLDKAVDAMPGLDDNTRRNMKESLKAQYEKARSAEDPEYNNIVRETVPEEYSPFMRFGEYWFRVKTGGVNGEPEFYKFDSAAERNHYKRVIAGELGVEPDDGNVFESGHGDTANERGEFVGSDGALAATFDIIDKSNLGDAQKESLKDTFYQARLEAMPDSSIRKRFMHAKNRTGFSTDPIRIFGATAEAYANELSKLEHVDRIDRAIEMASELLKTGGMKDDAAKQRLDVMLKRMVSSAKENVNPPVGNRLASALNTMNFIWFLSSARSALTNMTSIPMRVMPALWSRYGFIKGNVKFLQYLVAFDALQIKESDEDGDVMLTMPSLRKAGRVKNNPRRSAALREAVLRRVVAQTEVATVTGRTKTPTNLSSKATKRLQQTVYDAATSMFGATEAMSREMSFLMWYDLAYDKFKKTMSEKDAHVAAIDEAAEGTFDKLGDYRVTERPPVFKHPVGASIFMFKMFSAVQTKFFVKAILMSTRGLDPELKIEARKELLGVLSMAAMFGGATGLPLYSVVNSIIDLALDQFEDDEDKRKRRELNPYLANNADARFRYQYLPSHFGDITVPTLGGKQSSLARILEIGPISALSGFNFAPSTSYNGMWFREGLPGDTWVETAKNFLLANLGPTVSLGTNIDLAAKDWNNGDILRGVERVMPGFLKGPIMGERVVTEGLETSKGSQVVAPEDIDTISKIAAFLGFTPEAISRQQNMRFEAIKQIQRANTEKARAIALMNVAMATDDSDKAVAAGRAIEKYNTRYPGEEFQIDDETLDNSYKAFLKKRDSEIDGVPIEDDYLDDLEWYIAGGPIAEPTKPFKQ